MSRLCWLLSLLLGACAAHDPHAYLQTELQFLRPGVQLEAEEREVRRVLSQRGLRVVARLAGTGFIALGASTREQRVSAVRIISGRGVVIAEDGAIDDLFSPSRVVLLEHFGGTRGEYTWVASARIERGHDVGCVALHRLLPDGSAVQAQLDVSAFGSRACVANLAPARAGRMRATIAWPRLHVLATPQLEAELQLVEAPLGQPAPLVPVLRVVQQGEWLDAERTRLSTLRLARATFSERHAAGVARAALSQLTGHDLDTQLGAYRAALGYIPPGSPEAEVMAETTAHIERGWLDVTELPPEQQAAEEVIEPATEGTSAEPRVGEGDVIIEPLDD